MCLNAWVRVCTFAFPHVSVRITCVRGDVCVCVCACKCACVCACVYACAGVRVWVRMRGCVLGLFVCAVCAVPACVRVWCVRAQVRACVRSWNLGGVCVYARACARPTHVQTCLCARVFLVCLSVRLRASLRVFVSVR